MFPIFPTFFRFIPIFFHRPETVLGFEVYFLSGVSTGDLDHDMVTGIDALLGKWT